MCTSKSIARNLTHAAIANLLLLGSCWAQNPQATQSAVPPLPADIPANAAARIMNLDGDLGSIAAGKLADATLVNGDPVANISDIRKTALVMKDGVLYRPDELYSALGIAP